MGHGGYPEPRSLDLDDDLAPRGQARAVDLPEARRRNGPLMEGREQRVDGRTELSLDDGLRLVHSKRRHPILRASAGDVKYDNEHLAARNAAYGTADAHVQLAHVVTAGDTSRLAA